MPGYSAILHAFSTNSTAIHLPLSIGIVFRALLPGTVATHALQASLAARLRQMPSRDSATPPGLGYSPKATKQVQKIHH